MPKEIHTCESCGETFDSESELLEHEQTAHRQSGGSQRSAWSSSQRGESAPDDN